ncbi:MAG TPA: SDR family oxidoreductase [Chitinophagaceae bacterium]|nr:SDR family oxidoreductase [Chitinophagaceae bacterium]
MRILVTGGAGFIGANLAEKLLGDERVDLVRVMDNLSTGSEQNIEEFSKHNKFEFAKEDISDYTSCTRCCEGIDIISHQAALGSVPRSIIDPINTNASNITGTLNIFTAAKEKKIRRVVYAGSSSTYGDHPALPKTEDRIGNPLSPYAVTKYVSELYARVFADIYNMEFIGLRYFNIFGPRQRLSGAYAAVIPIFIKALMEHKPPTINGDGKHSRDFTYVDNAVQANLLAMFTKEKKAVNQVYNIACGQQTSLIELYNYLKKIANSDLKPVHGPARTGDVQHSLASIQKASELLGYQPGILIEEGLRRTFNWYQEKKVSA